MKKRQVLFLLLLVAGTLYIALEQRQQKGGETGNNTRKFSERVFGTVMNVTYTAQTDLHDSIMARLSEVDASLSMFNPQSTLARINRNETDTLDTHLLNILPMAGAVSKATAGAFDITVAPLVNAWGFGFKHGALPTDSQVDSLRALVDYRALSVQGGRLVKAIPDAVIDLSAIAKGYGVDQVANLLTENGVTDFLVEIGGEIVCRGNNPEGKPWHIGINKPVEDSTSTVNEVQRVLAVHDRAMATSGNYRNFYITPDGRKLAHTIDPATGHPVRHSLLSATVLAPSCAMADAFATSFMVMGLDSAKALLTRHEELQAFLIFTTRDGEYDTWTNISSLKEQ